MADSQKDLEQAPQAGQAPEAQALEGARTLEDILWSAADRWSEDGHVLVDRGEFAQQIFDAWGGETPTEEFLHRFFEGDTTGVARPADMAEAIVRASKERMSFYEFDLNALEYVVIEEHDGMIVVSGAGEFMLPADGSFRSALQDAIIPDSARAVGSGRPGIDRTVSGEPRAYFIQRSGEVVAVDVSKLAKAISSSRNALRAADAPMFERASRLLPFAPRRKEMTSEREAQILRRDDRVAGWQQGSAVPPRLAATLPAPPQDAEDALLLLLPDGTLARPVIGSASRWQDMLGQWAARAAAISLGAAAPPEAVLAEHTFMVRSDRVVAVFRGGSPKPVLDDGLPGSLGRSTEAQGGALASVRMLRADVRTLNEEALADAVARGAKLVAGLSAPLVVQGNTGAAFWIQPEVFFDPSARDVADAALDVAHRRGVDQLGESTTRQLVAQGYGEAAAQGNLVSGAPSVQLGQITGDPWADWALATGGELGPSELASLGTAFAARRGRSLVAPGAEQLDPLAPPGALRGRASELALFGEKVVGFRGPDGSLVLQTPGMVRLAEAGRLIGGPTGEEGARPPGQGAAIGARSGAIPAGSLRALAIALERTAAAAGYKLPPVTLVSADDAIGAGDQLSATLGPGSMLRTSARVMRGPEMGGPNGQMARMLLSMPFPSTGEVVVGGDLADALHALLGAPAQPAVAGPGAQGAASGIGGGAWLAGGALGGAAAGGLAGALALRGAGGAPGQLMVRGGPGGMPGQLVMGPNGTLVIDLTEQHQQARVQAQQALAQFEAPEVAQSLSSQASLSRLPVLLRRALAESGDWTPASGTAVPLGVQQLVLSSPYDLPELVAAEGASPLRAAGVGVLGRPVNPGEEEIVIPMPLWAQMGRGRLSETQEILASPRMPPGFAPPLGSYRLVAPQFIDFAGGAPAGTPGVETLRGPTQIMVDLPISARGPGAPASGVSARMDGGQHILARVPIDDGETVVGQRGRVRIGAPLDAAALAAVAARRRSGGSASDGSQAPGSAGRSGGSEGWTGPSGGQPGGPGSGIGASAPSGVPGSSFSGVPGRPSMPRLPDINLPDASTVSGSAVTGGAGRPMAGALQSALKLSDSVGGRTLPGVGPRPAIGDLPSLGGSGLASGGGSGLLGGGDVPSQLAVGRGFGGGSTSLVSGGGFGGAAEGASGEVSALASSAPSTGTVVAGAQASATQATSARWGAEGGSHDGGAGVSGLPPGAWSGAQRGSEGYAPWSYGPRSERSNTIGVGGLDLSQGLQRDPLPSLPTTLRFRYVGAPLWWSSSSLGAGAVAGGAESDFEGPDGMASRAVRSALRSANQASSIWRSILVHPSRAEGAGAAGQPVSGPGGNWDQGASQMSSMGDKMAILAFGLGGGAAGGAVLGKGAESVYVAMDESGRAGAVPGSVVGPGRPDSLHMSIVAAIPPSPPSLEQTAAHSAMLPSGSSSSAFVEPRARKHGHHGGGHGGGEAKGADEGVSHSKIEGSVDAIAQRIYHRIRRRIASDRERFGG